MKKPSTKKKLEDAVESLALEVRRLVTGLGRLETALSRSVIGPAEAMGDLTSELRVIRIMLDAKGEYSFMDRARAVAAAKAAAPAVGGDGAGNRAGGGGA
jgi:hypothetical protein